MPETNAIRVVGKDGLSGTLLDPASAGDSPVRIALDTGGLIEVPASLLHQQSPAAFTIELGPKDLDYEGDSGSSSSDTVIPVLAEELRVGRTPVLTGGVRVNRRVYEHEQTVDIPLRKEHVDVRRVLIERDVEGPLPVRREGDITIIPIVEEVIVVSKKFVLKEEVHVRRTVSEEHHREEIVVRRQEPDIERIDASGQAIAIDVPAVGSDTPQPVTRPEQEASPRPRRRSMIADVYGKP